MSKLWQRYNDISWRERRRRDVALLLLGALIVGLAAAAGAYFGDTERIGQYWTHAELDDAGRADVVEVIDYDFGINDRHGMLRVVPGSLRESITVSSPTAPDDLALFSTFDGLEMRIGDPDKTISNRHRYRIEYSIDGLVRGDVFAWNAVGLLWRVPINNVELHVTAPFDLVDPRCDRGRSSAVGGCEVVELGPGHISVRTSGLSDHEGVTVSASVGPNLGRAPEPPPPPQGPADDPGTGILVPALWAAVAALVGAGALWWVFRRLGREVVWAGGPVSAAFGPGNSDQDQFDETSVVRLDHSQLAELATIEFEAPAGISAAQGGVVYDERVRPQHRVAWLIESENRGEIIIDVDSPSRIIERGTEKAEPHVEDVLRTMFSGRTMIPIGSYDSSFAIGWAKLEQQLEAWRIASGLWNPRGRERRRRARIGGLVMAAIGLALAAAGGAAANRGNVSLLALALLGGLTAGAGIAALVKAWELPIRTPEGSSVWILVESFRRFIADSEARHAEAAAKMGLLRQYTAWAVALGELDHWEEAVNEAAAMPDSSASRLGPGLHHGGSFSRISAAAVTASTAPSSSGGGSGGGGFGGGGFGGGGAGSGGGGGGGGGW